MIYTDTAGRQFCKNYAQRDLTGRTPIGGAALLDLLSLVPMLSFEA